ncbi:hypothetical protein Rhe02_64510 [Rhizocola hellebori]|uniref:Copper chaperone PCu(A)C n=1 Tax=Rhizocola hellebori TaxID=1392758 RepID=A0A8J3QCS6_9ACTN|nr:hypothetical protein Rhe02_64510 [Rhizocola hellebori]
MAAAVLAGCGTGKYSQTAQQVAPVPGYSQNFSIAQPPGSVGVSNAHLPYPGVGGYKAGAEAPLELWLYNNTQNPLTVVVTSEAGTVEDNKTIVPVGGLVKPEMTITGLKNDIKPGESLTITIEFVGYVKTEAVLPVSSPEEALPRSPMQAPAGEGH